MPRGWPRLTYFSPSSDVICTEATALAGRLTSPRTFTVTTAVQPSSLTLSTLPTGTSLTFTADCGTRSRTLANWILILYG